MCIKHNLCLFVTKCCTSRAIPRQSHTLCIVINVVKYVTCVTFPITTFITTRSTPIKTFPCLTSPCVWDVVFFPQPLVLLRPFIVEIVGCGHFLRCLSHFLVSHLGFIYWLCISLRGDIPRQSQSFLEPPNFGKTPREIYLGKVSPSYIFSSLS